MSDEANGLARPLSHVRRYLCDLDQYVPGTPAELVARKHGHDPARLIKLASNENPHGMSLRASSAARAALKDAHRYPDDYGLIQAIAGHYHISPDQVVLGNGSNDVLALIARTFLGEGTAAVASQYAYAFYKIVTRTTGAEYTVVPAKDYGYDLDAMHAAITPQTRVIWVNNPANPTGTFLPYDDIHRFIASVPEDVIVVLDEAYGEYLNRQDRADTLPWLQEFPNLVLVRTFSKIYGLAGFRIGYAIASHDVADILNRVALPFNHNGPALAAATAALSDQAFIRFSAAGNVTGREQLTKGLHALGLETMPSYGNFVTVRTGSAMDLAHELEARGVITRPLDAYGLHDWLRITIGLHHHNSRLLSELSDMLTHPEKRHVGLQESSISEL